MHPLRVSVVLPVRNQADHIAQVITEYAAAMPSACASSFEFILVLNGCSDSSSEECHKIRRRFPFVVVTESKSVGWGAAIRAGIKLSRGEIICLASSARVSAEVLSEFVRRGLETPNVVHHAIRPGQDNWFRALGSRMFNFECRKLFGVSVRDVNGTPKVFPRSFDKLLQMSRNDFVLDLEFDYICEKYGYPIVEVPIGPTPRHGGRSMTTTLRALELIFETLMFRLKSYASVD